MRGRNQLFIKDMRQQTYVNVNKPAPSLRADRAARPQAAAETTLLRPPFLAS